MRFRLGWRNKKGIDRLIKLHVLLYVELGYMIGVEPDGTILDVCSFFCIGLFITRSIHIVIPVFCLLPILDVRISFHMRGQYYRS